MNRDERGIAMVQSADRLPQAEVSDRLQLHLNSVNALVCTRAATCSWSFPTDNALAIPGLLRQPPTSCSILYCLPCASVVRRRTQAPQPPGSKHPVVSRCHGEDLESEALEMQICNETKTKRGPRMRERRMPRHHRRAVSTPARRTLRSVPHSFVSVSPCTRCTLLLSCCSPPHAMRRCSVQQ